MPHKNIFCATPWYEIHIYWDGGLGICCVESHRLYKDTETQYNIANMSIMEWFNTEPPKKIRRDMAGSSGISICSQCYIEEGNGWNSRRFNSNMKSVIFTRNAFDASYSQSPGLPHFQHSIENQGHADTHPIDLHIDLGNFCNLACKMCDPSASSTIASQEVRWGIESSKKFVGVDWTKDPVVWQRFKDELLTIPHLNNIHFMGGETLLTDRMEDLVDHMIQHKRFDVCFSFVTNGTIFRARLLDKLSKFRRVGIEVSIETLTKHNAYVRQGTDTQQVLDNIKHYQNWCTGNVSLTLRPAPNILTIGNYTTLLEYALENKLVVKSVLVTRPDFMDATILPESIKQLYLTRYQDLLSRLEHIDASSDYNASDPAQYVQIVKQQILMITEVLKAKQPDDAEARLKKLVQHCKRWDAVYNLNAWDLYPEFEEILSRYGYGT